MDKPTILIVEDEEKLASVLQDYLQQADYQTHMIHDGAEVMPWFNSNHCNLVLLDIMLPNKNGMELCKEIRHGSDVPIIMCTARIEEIDRLLGLELGADDYVCKPYSPREVVLRVKAILRRLQRASEPNPETVEESPIQLDGDKYKAFIHKNELELTAIEFQLLSMMVKEPGRIFSREQLMDNAYKDHRIVSDRTIDSHIKKLRKKIKTAADGKDYIHSVYGVGYKFEDKEDE
ncbi:MAG: response regulator [Pseudomonadales bacterium]|nr:response regulator [Pseudomonadales bacterium]